MHLQRQCVSLMAASMVILCNSAEGWDQRPVQALAIPASCCSQLYRTQAACKGCTDGFALFKASHKFSSVQRHHVPMTAGCSLCV